jgi:hypothetical protein
MYARDDAAMERIELARIVHEERIRAVETALHRRRLLHANDDDTQPTSDPMTSPAAASVARPASPAQPAGPTSPRRSTSPVR